MRNRMVWSWVRRAAAVALLAAGWGLLATDAVEHCEQQQSQDGTVSRVCRPLSSTDPLVLGWVLAGLALFTPDLAEFGVPGLLSLRLRVADTERRTTETAAELDRVHLQVHALTSSRAVATVNVNTGAQTAELAAGGPGGPVDPADVGSEALAEARFQAGDAALRALLGSPGGPLAGAAAHLYLPDDQGLLVPVSEDPDGPAATAGWRPGQGCVGLAWDTGEVVSARDYELRAQNQQFTGARRAAYDRLAVVAAAPVLNASGRVIGVLSASSRDPAAPLDSPAGSGELTALAARTARIVIDLFGWDDDTPVADDAGPDPSRGEE